MTQHHEQKGEYEFWERRAYRRGRADQAKVEWLKLALVIFTATILALWCYFHL